jgi:hypothetical protein
VVERSDIDREVHVSLVSEEDDNSGVPLRLEEVGWVVGWAWAREKRRRGGAMGRRCGEGKPGERWARERGRPGRVRVCF